MYIVSFVVVLQRDRERETKLRLKIFSKGLGSSSSKATTARSSLEYRYFRRLSEFSIFFSTPRAASTLYARRLRSVPDLSINCKYYRVFQYWKTVADWLPITFGPTISFSLSVSYFRCSFACVAHTREKSTNRGGSVCFNTLNVQITYVRCARDIFPDYSETSISLQYRQYYIHTSIFL